MTLTTPYYLAGLNDLTQAAWRCVHSNQYWTYQDGTDKTVVANFSDVTVLDDGTPLLRGTGMDEYGWWHGPLVIDLTKVRNMKAGIHTDGPAKKEWPEAAPFKVGLHFEWRRGLIRLTIPDDDARRLNEWKRKVWIEIVGMADGYTPAPKRGTWEHKALAYLHSVASHLTDKHPFIEGESFEGSKDEHRNNADYGLLVSTFGVVAGPNPTVGFHFSG